MGLREVVPADGLGDAPALNKKKKKKKKVVPAAWNATADLEATKARQVAEMQNPLAEEETAAESTEPEPVPAPVAELEQAGSEATEPPKRRKKKKKAVAT